MSFPEFLIILRSKKTLIRSFLDDIEVTFPF